MFTFSFLQHNNVFLSQNLNCRGLDSKLSGYSATHNLKLLIFQGNNEGNFTTLP